MMKSFSRRSFLARGAAVTSAALISSACVADRRVRIRHPNLPAGAAGTLWIGGDLQVNRMGLGGSEFSAPEHWGEPKDPEVLRALIRRAVDLGVNYIDTADVYGPRVSERLIYEALYPYSPDLVIATKGGQTRDSPGPLNGQDGRPTHLRAACEASLKRLGLEQIAVYQMHEPDPKVPYEDSIGELAKLQEEGKIRHIGLCNVDVALLAKARSVATVVSVQIPYNYLSRESDQLLSICERDHMAFLPARPLGTGQLVNSTDSRLAGLQAIAKERNISQPQAVLAWLLARSPVMLVIPGTRQVEHLEDNIAAAKVRFTKQEMERIG